MIDAKEITDIVEIQNRQISVDKQIIPAWFKETSEKLLYPICKEGDYFILLVPYEYFPTKVARDDHVFVLLDDILQDPVKVFISIYFDAKGTCIGVKLFLPDGTRFEHYHSGVSNDWDCLGSIKKVNHISQLYNNESALGQRFIESLQNGLDIIRIDSVTMNQPANDADELNLPHIDNLEYDTTESISVWNA